MTRNTPIAAEKKQAAKGTPSSNALLLPHWYVADTVLHALTDALQSVLVQMYVRTLNVAFHESFSQDINNFKRLPNK